MKRLLSLVALSCLTALVGPVLLSANAYALDVSRNQLQAGQLRLDGGGAVPGTYVTVESASSFAGARADLTGAYHVQAAGFRSDDCTAVVSDRQTPVALVTLSGCTATPALPAGTDPLPTGSCVISPQAAATFDVGDLHTYFFTTTGCDTSNSPVQWSLLAGHIPPGMTGPSFQGQVSGAVSGRPTTEGTYSFRLQVIDSAGRTDTATFTVTVVGPRPVTVTDPGRALPTGTAGQDYCCVRLAADGGLPGYLWTLAGGVLPAGLRLTSLGAISGTPTARGTFAFTVRATNSRHATVTRPLVITIG